MYFNTLRSTYLVIFSISASLNLPIPYFRSLHSSGSVFYVPSVGVLPAARRHHSFVINVNMIVMPSTSILFHALGSARPSNKLFINLRKS